MVWAEFFLAAFSGGLTVATADITYKEWVRRRTQKENETQRIDALLDPVLKAADAVAAKFRALAERDFLELRGVSGHGGEVGGALVVTLYLVARFWAEVEVLRRKDVEYRIQKDGRGKRLARFLEALQSRRVRLVDRGTQQAIGELLLEGPGHDANRGPYFAFAERCAKDKMYRAWLAPLFDLLEGAASADARQKLLVYGVVVHAMIDNLDPGHVVTKKRPTYPNKLSRRSRRLIKHKIFRNYCPPLRSESSYYRDTWS